MDVGFLIANIGVSTVCAIIGSVAYSRLRNYKKFVGSLVIDKTEEDTQIYLQLNSDDLLELENMNVAVLDVKIVK